LHQGVRGVLVGVATTTASMSAAWVIWAASVVDGDTAEELFAAALRRAS
jgi:hypothetical protein